MSGHRDTPRHLFTGTESPIPARTQAQSHLCTHAFTHTPTHTSGYTQGTRVHAGTGHNASGAHAPPPASARSLQQSPSSPAVSVLISCAARPELS